MQQNTLATAAGLTGIGLVAGLIGTLAMTAGQKAEMALTRRPPSDTPAKAIESIAGDKVNQVASERQLSTAGHLAFGTGLGLGLAALAPVPEPVRAGLFFAGAWSAGAALLTGLGLSDPPTRWDAKKLAIDLGHHAVYAATAAVTFLGLRRLARL
jgi:hypothetical protein